MNLALFDFDGTITSRDSFTAFIKFSSSRARFVFGCILILPIFLGYRIGLISSPVTRKIAAWLSFKGRSFEDLDRKALEYAKEVIPGFVRPEALARIDWHKSRGDRIVVVSASLDIYLRHWCRAQQIELLCSQLEEKNGRITGRLVPDDCSGTEKVRRILETYILSDYKTIYAYGDTPEDRQMLDLAHVKYYRGKEISDPK